jgi:hypothetical protein
MQYYKGNCTVVYISKRTKWTKPSTNNLQTKCLAIYTLPI